MDTKTLAHSAQNLPLPSDRWEIEFPMGLFGFPEIKRYALSEETTEGPFRWLAMVESPERRFLVLPPERVVADYQPVINREDARFLEIESLGETWMLGVVTQHLGGKATINLKSPILIHRTRRVGIQIIPRNVSAFTAQYPVGNVLESEPPSARPAG